jgi:hypothetical protein
VGDAGFRYGIIPRVVIGDQQVGLVAAPEGPALVPLSHTVSPAISANDQRLQALLQELPGHALAPALEFVALKLILKFGALESYHQITTQ